MTQSFLAFAWDGGNPTPERLTSLIDCAQDRFGLERIFDGEGLCVLAHPETPYALIGGQGGVVLGSLFSREHPDRPVHTGDEALQAPVGASAGDSLLTSLWGGYVAFIAEPDGLARHVLRDPSGFLTCYWHMRDGLAAFFSDIEAPIALGLIAPELDPTFAAHHLAFGDLRTTRTGLVGVHDLLAGTRLSLSGGRTSVSCRWTPWAFAAGAWFEDRTLAIGELRRQTDACVAAWARASAFPLLELSGGLDSSIVAASLAKAGSTFSCATLATPDPGGDERTYARRMAQAVDTTLFEATLSLETADPCRSPHLISVRPGLGVLQQVADQAFIGAVADAPVDSFFSGGGGDNVFCYVWTAAPAADALRRKGPTPVFFKAISDLAELHGCTTWRAAHLAIRKALRPARLTWRRNTQFLAEGAAPIAPIPHPWFDAPLHALPGAIEHVAALMRIQNISDGKERLGLAPIRYPLLSQPIVELCLRIPSWMWIAGGRNRAVARDAFADRLPAEILARRSKGNFIPFCGAIYERHRAALADHLLGGWLDGQGLLDRAAVAAYFNVPGPPQGEGFYRLLDLAAVESWARAWAARRQL